MAKIRDDIGTELAAILGADQVELTELLDREGLHLVYDISRLSDAGSFVVSHRNFDTGGIAQNVTVLQRIAGLPPLFQVFGIFVRADTIARVAEVVISAPNMTLPAGAIRDDLWWRWIVGDPSFANPVVTGLRVGNGIAGGTMLDPPLAQRYLTPGRPQTYAQNAKRRTGIEPAGLTVRVTATAFGAGTVAVDGTLILGLNIGALPRSIFALPVAGG